MPRDVDRNQRLADIAEATIRVARRSGPGAVTIRAVAKEMGGSTTLITNYLPSRSALIINALDHGQSRWSGGLETVLRDVEPRNRMDAVMDWYSTPSDLEDDPVLRSFILEIVASSTSEPELTASLRAEAAQFRTVVADAARDSGYTDPDMAADAIYLAMRGAMIASVEDPHLWEDTHHLTETISWMLSRLPRRADGAGA